jgi:hypothetical protein
VEPQVLGGGDVRELLERVERARVDGAGGTDQHGGRAARAAVGRDRGAQLLGVEAAARQRHGPDRLAAEPEQLDGPRHAAVGLRRHVGEQPRPAGEPCPAHVASRPAARPGQADDRRRRRPAGQQAGARRVRVAHQLRQPAHGRALEVHVRVVAGDDARVHRGCGQRRQHARERRRRVDPAEECRMPVPHRVGQHVAHHRRGERLDVRRPVRERQREQPRAQVPGQRLPDGVPGQRGEVIRDRVDERVAGAPELVQVAGAELTHASTFS